MQSTPALRLGQLQSVAILPHHLLYASLMLVPTVLVFFGLSFGAFGAWALVAPQSLATLLNFELATAGAVTELRAFYGGLEIALCALMLAAVAKPELVRPALVGLIVVAGGIAVGRMVGLVLDGSASGMMFGALAWEIAGAVFGVIAYRSLPALA